MMSSLIPIPESVRAEIAMQIEALLTDDIPHDTLITALLIYKNNRTPEETYALRLEIEKFFSEDSTIAAKTMVRNAADVTRQQLAAAKIPLALQLFALSFCVASFYHAPAYSAGVLSGAIGALTGATLFAGFQARKFVRKDDLLKWMQENMPDPSIKQGKTAGTVISDPSEMVLQSFKKVVDELESTVHVTAAAVGAPVGVITAVLSTGDAKTAASGAVIGASGATKLAKTVTSPVSASVNAMVGAATAAAQTVAGSVGNAGAEDTEILSIGAAKLGEGANEVGRGVSTATKTFTNAGQMAADKAVAARATVGEAADKAAQAAKDAARATAEEAVQTVQQVLGGGVNAFLSGFGKNRPGSGQGKS